MPTPLISGRVAVSRYSRRSHPDFENNIGGCGRCYTLVVFPKLGFKASSVHFVAGRKGKLGQRGECHPSRTPGRKKANVQTKLKGLQSSSSSELSSALSSAFIAPTKSSDSPFWVASLCPTARISIPRPSLKGTWRTY